MPTETDEVATEDPDEAFEVIADAYATVAPSPSFTTPAQFGVHRDAHGVTPETSPAA